MSERKTLFIALAEIAYEGDIIISVCDKQTYAKLAIKLHDEKNNEQGYYEYRIDEVIMNSYDRDY